MPKSVSPFIHTNPLHGRSRWSSAALGQNATVTPCIRPLLAQLSSAVEQAVPPLPVAVLGPIIKKSLPAWSIDYDRFLGDSLVIDSD